MFFYGHHNTGSVETLKRMVDLNAGITILPELSLLDFTAEQRKRIIRFQDPVPAREISLVTHRSFIKRGIINSLKEKILGAVPKDMLSNTKKSLMEPF